MPKNPSHSWGVTVLAKDNNGTIVYNPNGKPQKKKVPMQPGCFANGELQSLYYPDGHEKAGWFKGMSQILWERGFEAESKLQAECKGFHCPSGEIRCCCRWFLYNQPDFMHVESVLEATCCVRSVQVLFLPKFHCELNFIKQVWGHAKCVYRQFLPLSKESKLEKNVIQALDSVSLPLMHRWVGLYALSPPVRSITHTHRYARRSYQFLDAYRRNLTGKQAAWVAKKYYGHCVLPDSLFSIPKL